MKKLNQDEKTKAASFLGKTVGSFGMSMLFDFAGQFVFVAIVVGMVVCLFNCQ